MRTFSAKMVNEIIIKLSCFCAALPLLAIGAELQLRYNPKYIVPRLEGLPVKYQQGRQDSYFTTFRVNVSEDRTEFIYVSVAGESMNCGRDLFVMPLTDTQVNSWDGLWLACTVLRSSEIDGVRRCTFGCPCHGGCAEVQVSRRPPSYRESEWTLNQLCLSFQDTTATNRCGGMQKKCIGKDNYDLDPISLSLQAPFDVEIYDGVAWLVIMRRLDGSVDFNREWEDYKCGFGEMAGEMWAGNENVYRLLEGTDRDFALRIDLESYDGVQYAAVYSEFCVYSESDNYTLHVSGYDSTSTAGDGLTYLSGAKFSTAIEYHAATQIPNCAQLNKASWWYSTCTQTVLTGPYGSGTENEGSYSMTWSTSEGDLAVKYVRMMIRPLSG